MLKKEIEGKVRDFYLVGFDESGLSYSDDYKKKVLSLDKDKFKASLRWLLESNALDAEQAEQVLALRKYRNDIAHELPKFLVEVGHEVDVARIREVKDLIAVLGRFWGRIEVETDPDFVGPGGDDVDIYSGGMLLMEHLVAAAEAG